MEKFWSKLQRWGLTAVNRKKAIPSVGALSTPFHLRSPPPPSAFCLSSSLFFCLFFRQLALPLLLCLCFLGLCVSVTVNTLATWHRSTFLLDRAHRERHLGVCVCVFMWEGAGILLWPSAPLSEHTYTRTHTCTHSPWGSLLAWDKTQV